MRRLSLALLMLFVFTVPWQNATGYVTNALWAAAFVGTIATGLLERRIARPPALFLAMLAFVAWQLTTYYWSIDPESSLARVRLMIFMLVLVWMVTELAASERIRHYLMQAYVLGCFVLCGILINAFISGHAIDGYRYVPSNFNPNVAADMIAVGVAMALLITGSRYGRKLLILNIAFVPLGLFGVILTASRSGFFLTCLAAVGVFFVLRHTRLLYRAAWFVVLVGVFAGVFFGLAANQTLGVNLQRLTFQTGTYSLGTLTGRTTIWSAGLEHFEEHPLAGVGAGTFNAAVEGQLGGRNSAHNVFIETAVETGTVGLILLIVALVASASPVLHWRDHQTGLRMVLLMVVIGASLVANISAYYLLWFVLAVLSRTGATNERPVEGLSSAAGDRSHYVQV